MGVAKKTALLFFWGQPCIVLVEKKIFSKKNGFRVALKSKETSYVVCILDER